MEGGVDYSRTDLKRDAGCHPLGSSERACFQKALDAAMPNSWRRCIECLENDILANSTVFNQASG